MLQGVFDHVKKYFKLALEHEEAPLAQLADMLVMVSHLQFADQVLKQLALHTFSGSHKPCETLRVFAQQMLQVQNRGITRTHALTVHASRLWLAHLCDDS